MPSLIQLNRKVRFFYGNASLCVHFWRWMHEGHTGKKKRKAWTERRFIAWPGRRSTHRCVQQSRVRPAFCTLPRCTGSAFNRHECDVRQKAARFPFGRRSRLL